MAKKQINKTNAMRNLDAAKIEYDCAEYDYDESDLSGVHAAKELGVPEEQVFKTLVAMGDNNLLSVYMVPVAESLDLKKAAVCSGNKRIELIPVKDIQRHTGYIRGGCSPIGMKKQYPTYIDRTAVQFDRIYFSAGKRGVQIILNAEILAKHIDAEFSDLLKK